MKCQSLQIIRSTQKKESKKLKIFSGSWLFIQIHYHRVLQLSPEFIFESPFFDSKNLGSQQRLHLFICCILWYTQNSFRIATLIPLLTANLWSEVQDFFAVPFVLTELTVLACRVRILISKVLELLPLFWCSYLLNWCTVSISIEFVCFWISWI